MSQGMSEERNNVNGGVSGSAALQEEQRQDSTFTRARREFLRNRVAIVCLLILVLVTLSAVFAHQLSPYDPYKQNARARKEAPSAQHLFGTDSLGRDTFSRVLYGGRISLQVGIFSVALGALVGVPLGVMAGFFGGWLDGIIMRTMDVILTFPGLILLIWLRTVLGSGVENMIFVLAFFSLPTYARLTRGNTLSIREMEYVLAARSLGANGRRIVFLHILPAIFPPIIVVTTLAVSGAIIAGASLSYLGLGVFPSTPEWGAMLSDGRAYIRNEWWLSFFPGMIITLVVLALNVIGDAMRDALDPKVTAGR